MCVFVCVLQCCALQCAAVCCDVLDSKLQGVAVSCSVLKELTVTLMRQTLVYDAFLKNRYAYKSCRKLKSFDQVRQKLKKLKKLRTQIYMNLRYTDPQARVLNYFYK